MFPPQFKRKVVVDCTNSHVIWMRATANNCFRGSSIEIDKCAFVHLCIFRCTTQRRTRIYPRFGVHLCIFRCTNAQVVHWLNLVLNRSRLEDSGERKKEESRFIVNTNPALVRILTENTSMQAENPTNERQAKAAAAEGSGSSNAAAAARNNKQQKENVVDVDADVAWFKQKLKDYENPMDGIVITKIEDPFVAVSVRRNSKKTRLVSICGRHIQTIPLQSLLALMALFDIGGYRSKRDKYSLSMLAVQAKVNGNVTVPKGNTRINYFRLINCLFHPTIKPKYAKYNQQPGTDTLTSGKKHNQELFEMMLPLYNGPVSNASLDLGSDSSDDDGELDDWNVGTAKAEHPKLSNNIDFTIAKFGQLRDWKQVQMGVKTVHKKFKVVLIDWKKSGEHRGMADVLEAMKIDVHATGSTKWVFSQDYILYFFLLTQSNPNIFNSVGGAIAPSAKYDSAMPGAASYGKKPGRGKAGADDATSQSDGLLSIALKTMARREESKKESEKAKDERKAASDAQLKLENNARYIASSEERLEKLSSKKRRLKKQKKTLERVHAQNQSVGVPASQDASVDSTKNLPTVARKYNNVKAEIACIEDELERAKKQRRTLSCNVEKLLACCKLPPAPLRPVGGPKDGDEVVIDVDADADWDSNVGKGTDVGKGNEVEIPTQPMFCTPEPI